MGSAELIGLSHCNEEPHGVWWSAIKEHFIVNHIAIPDTVYGQPIREFAHRSDILRILILEDMGGIYADSDIFMSVLTYFKRGRCCC